MPKLHGMNMCLNIVALELRQRTFIIGAPEKLLWTEDHVHTPSNILVVDLAIAQVLIPVRFSPFINLPHPNMLIGPHAL